MDIRSDVFFEIHSLDMINDQAEFLAWVKSQKKSYLQKLDPRFPNALAYPLDEMVAKYGSYFFTSSVSYMFALAIEQKPTHIGLWGIDMCATEEYNSQRAGCHYFVQKARDLGIEVVAPVESDILAPTPMYGFCGQSPMYRRLIARRAELRSRFNGIQQNKANLHDDAMALSGALDDIDYMLNTWV